ncbi:MAG: hypothetical protein LBP23_07310 [Treponema sp.]|jgi:hypothetical protein|nr:hypothetical protein [Treponema sp.]
MANVGYDSTFDFGALTAQGNFPNILNLGKTNANQFAVDIFAPVAVVGGPITITISGGDSAASQTNVVGSKAFTAEELNGTELCQVAISPNKYQYLKVSASAAASGPGSWTAGTISAILNTYIGK